MCLLKHEQTDTNCGHEECKKFYMLNKPMCVYNSGNMLNPANLLLPNQNPQRQFSQPSSGIGMNIQPSLNVKRPGKLPVQNSSDEKEQGMSTKKMVKTKDEPTSGELQPAPSIATETPFNLSDLTMFPQQLGNADPRSFFNNPLFGNLFMANPQPNIPKADPSMTQFNDIMASFIQNSQANAVLGNMGAQQGGNFPFPNQFISQTMKGKPNQMTNLPEVNINDKTKIEHSTTCEAFMREFQARTLGLLFTQNKMLIDLKEKNDILQDTLACLINEINTLKNTIGQAGQEKSAVPSGNPLMMHQILGNSTESVTVENLITYLYGNKPDFQFQLVLKTDLGLPLYRERNFKFTVMLVDMNGNLIENSNRIPLTIGIYSSENPPKYIDANTAGNKILKGFIEKDLINGSATFEKIQIKEVTSHFRNGWVFFVVYPKISKNPNNNILMSGNGIVVNSPKIKPLILEKVIVKAKKTKEKDQAGDYDGSPNSGYQQDSAKDDILYE